MVQHGRCGQFATKASPVAMPDPRAVHADLGEFLAGVMRAGEAGQIMVGVDGVSSSWDDSAEELIIGPGSIWSTSVTEFRA